MKTIELTYGRKTLVDDEDYYRLIRHTWFAKRENGHWLAARRDREGSIVYMHEEIAQPEEGWGVRHKDPYQTLNNRRENLVRYKIEAPRPTQRPYRGVYVRVLSDGSYKYVARIKFNKKNITVGRFTDPVEAAKAYDRTNYDLNGCKALAVANFPEYLMEYIGKKETS